MTGRKRIYADAAARQRAYRSRRLSDLQQRLLMRMFRGEPLSVVSMSVAGGLLRRGYIRKVDGSRRVGFVLTSEGVGAARAVVEAALTVDPVVVCSSPAAPRRGPVTDLVALAGYSSRDLLFEDAVRWMVGQGSCSVSGLQRQFRIGFTRASGLVKAMESRGVVGPPNGVSSRQVLLSPGDVDALLNPT